jgi:hypothetical protein
VWPKPPLKIEPGPYQDSTLIEGILFANDFFRDIGPNGFAIGTAVIIEKREGQMIVFRKIDKFYVANQRKLCRERQCTAPEDSTYCNWCGRVIHKSTAQISKPPREL